MYLIFACAGLGLLLLDFSSCSEQGLLSVAVRWLFIVEASFAEEHRGLPGGTVVKNSPTNAGFDP